MSYATKSFNTELEKLLRSGGVGLLPTDTIYGLSCLALDVKAVERLCELKKRDKKKPFIILISGSRMLDRLSIRVGLAQIVAPFWPGAVSVVFPAPNAPDWLHRGTGALAVRWPDHNELNRLIDKVGPIISTSANLQGQPAVRTAEAAQRLFGTSLDFYVDTGKLYNPPSTLAIIKKGKLQVVRQGAVKI